jgi:4-hydroxyacetophenone monooxygenase
MNIELPRKKLDLSSAVAEGDIRVLLMVLVHMTGDERWLEPPYKPKRDVRLIPDPQAGVPPEIQAEIRAAVLKLFETESRSLSSPIPADELMLKMMRATLGEKRRAGICAIDARGNGLHSPGGALDQATIDEKLAQQHVLIVGAGVCAIALGVALGRLGIPYTIVEKNAELGGTWYVNRYPGCGVDTPNHSYSFSFGARNPWTRYFAQRQELLDYLKKVALEYDIRKHLRLNTELTSSRWDENKRRWISYVKTANGEETFESTTLVSAIGQLNDPSPAHFKGEEDFKGECCTRPCGPMTSSSTANMSPSSAPAQPRCSWCRRSPTASRRSPSTNAPRNGRAPWQAIPIPSPKARSGCSRICRFTCSGIASTCSGATATACCRSCARIRNGRTPSAPSTRAMTGIARS